MSSLYIVALFCFSSVFTVVESTFTHGQDAINREDLDRWENAIYIPEPHRPIPIDAHVVDFKFYARQTGSIYMQIWRKTSSMVYQLVSSDLVTVNRTGVQTYRPDNTINVKQGDVIGFYFPDKSLIPFNGRTCWSERTLYKTSPSASDNRVGSRVRFQLKQSSWNPCRKYSISVTLKATVTPNTEPHQIFPHGNTPTNRGKIDSWYNAMYIASPAHPLQVGGKVLSWDFYSYRRTGTIYLQIFRKSTGYGNNFKLVGQTKYVISRTGPVTVSLEKSAQFEVKAGDYLGFYFPSHSIIPFSGSPGCTDSSKYGLYNKSPSRVEVGRVYTFRTMERGWGPCREYSLRVNIGTAGGEDEGSGSGSGDDDDEGGDDDDGTILF